MSAAVKFPPSQAFVRALNAYLAADRARERARATLDAAAHAAHVPAEVVRSLIANAARGQALERASEAPPEPRATRMTFEEAGEATAALCRGGK